MSSSTDYPQVHPSYVADFRIDGLWNDRDIALQFKPDVNILIGPNASGKTTVLNLLRYTLSGDVARLGEIIFSEVAVTLRRFEGRGQRQVRVTAIDRGFRYTVSNRTFDIDLDPRMLAHPGHPARTRLRYQSKQLIELLGALAPAVWLPVSRRLPIPEEEEEDFRTRRHSRLESVDARLRDLLDDLSRYRLGLEARLSDRYKQFEKRVLQSMLFSRQHDRLASLEVESLSPSEKDQLIRAFQAAGLLDGQMSRRIEEHFEEAEKAVQRWGQKDREQGFALQDVFILPLIGRTKALTEFARQLEQQREELFAPLKKYEDIVNSFLESKQFSVLDKGGIRIVDRARGRPISPDQLSSGEKQILILLTQALLRENEPVIYVADEPELSLHVLWQEKLLPSLLDLGRQIQIIVATHSPDIVGPFSPNVIDLGKLK